jgi:hypothetical protein
MFSWINRLALKNVGVHVPNPDGIADLTEPRIKPLVGALEALGAEVFVCCAGHGHRAYKGELCWPKICFRADFSFAQQMATDLFRHPDLHYLWLLTGYFPPSYGFTLAFHLSVWGYVRFDHKRVDEDLAWLRNYLQNFTAAHSMSSNEMPAKTCHIVRAPSGRFSPMPSMHSEQTLPETIIAAINQVLAPENQSATMREYVWRCVNLISSATCEMSEHADSDDVLRNIRNLPGFVAAYLKYVLDRDAPDWTNYRPDPNDLLSMKRRVLRAAADEALGIRLLASRHHESSLGYLARGLDSLILNGFAEQQKLIPPIEVLLSRSAT